MANADAEITQACIEALAEAIAVTSFITGNEKQVNAIIRVLTDLAGEPKAHPSRRQLLRGIAMQLHDERIRNAEWKKNLSSEDETPQSPK